MENTLDLARQVVRNLEQAQLNYRGRNMQLLAQDLDTAAKLTEGLRLAIERDELRTQHLASVRRAV